MSNTLAAREHVLVVDDESSVCSVLVRALSREGFVSWSAGSGDEALDMLRQRDFGVVISDLNMPGISGLQLLDRCRVEYPSLVFLIVTGEDDVQVGVEAMKRGADDYLVKPFQVQAVVRNVQRALEKKRLQLELERYHHRLEEMVEDRTQQLKAALGRVEATYDETLEALGAALDLRDEETAGHSRRVNLYSQAIARSMGHSDEALKCLARGAHLHDIGKIGIPDSILRKPGKLTPEETVVMRTHVAVGYELVRRIRFLAAAAELVLSHHERFDGKGYPRGLSGGDIPLDARIFAVADTLDAMTSDRPYRGALPFSIAWEEISSGSGLQFDPEVVQVFRLMPKAIWEDIRRWESVDHLPGEGPSGALEFPISGLIGLEHTSYA
jgi:putative nucleotidyltransferase with HDIG domain